MERREAAEFLGVSLSTLDRLASSGRLTRGRARRKTRPVTTYDQAELARLKEELAQGESARSVPREATSKPLDTVGFRLDPHYLSRLRTEGEAKGLSAGEYARRLVIQGLEDTAADRFKDEVLALREALADTFYAFLTLKCDVPKKEATAFVRDTILKGVKPRA